MDISKEIELFFFHYLETNEIKRCECILFKNAVYRCYNTVRSSCECSHGMNIIDSFQLYIYLELIKIAETNPHNILFDFAKHFETEFFWNRTVQRNDTHRLSMNNTYSTKPTKYYTLFFNNFCYDEFLTVQNIRSYALFIIESGTKHVLHLLNFLQILDNYLHDKNANDFYMFMLNNMKTIGLAMSGLFNLGYKKREYAHELLSEFPLYIAHVNNFFANNKNEFAWIYEQIYDNYDANVTGNRVVTDEYVFKCIAKFL